MKRGMCKVFTTVLSISKSILSLLLTPIVTLGLEAKQLKYQKPPTQHVTNQERSRQCSRQVKWLWAEDGSGFASSANNSEKLMQLIKFNARDPIFYGAHSIKCYFRALHNQRTRWQYFIVFSFCRIPVRALAWLGMRCNPRAARRTTRGLKGKPRERKAARLVNTWYPWK